MAGNIAHSSGRMPLLDRIAFHGGSTNWVGAPGSVAAERLAHHPFPRVELEQQVDRLVLGVDEAGRAASRPIVSIVDHQGGEAGLLRAVLEIGERAVILGSAQRAGEVQPHGPCRSPVQPSISRSCSELNWSASLRHDACARSRPPAIATGTRRSRTPPSACRRCIRAASPGPARRSAGRSGRRGSDRRASKLAAIQFQNAGGIRRMLNNALVGDVRARPARGTCSSSSAVGASMSRSICSSVNA